MVSSLFDFEMEQILPYLHPHPGWGNCSLQDVPLVEKSNTTYMLGRHCILELYNCDSLKLNDEAHIRTSITTAARLAGATLLKLVTHHFEPHGVTGLALLAESHISIHTWPEHLYAAVDVFTCGDHTMPERACEILRRELLAENYSLKSFQREPPASMMVSPSL